MHRSTATYFEQVPVAAVKKKLLEELPKKEAASRGQVVGAGKISPALHLQAHVLCRKGL
jgi:hypothetical protein